MYVILFYMMWLLLLDVLLCRFLPRCIVCRAV